MTLSDAERQGLAAALGEINPAYAQWLTDTATTVARYPTPFFHRFGVYQVIQQTPFHALGFYAAWAAGEPAFLLTDEPQNFIAVALADGVSLDTPALAAAYVVAYLDTTRSADELWYVVDSVGEVRFYPDPGAAERERIGAFRARYAEIIGPPAARRVGDDWRVTVFGVRQQALERTVAQVTRFGALETRTEVLEAGLPAVFAA